MSITLDTSGVEIQQLFGSTLQQIQPRKKTKENLYSPLEVQREFRLREKLVLSWNNARKSGVYTGLLCSLYYKAPETWNMLSTSDHNFLSTHTASKQ